MLEDRLWDNMRKYGEDERLTEAVDDLQREVSNGVVPVGGDDRGGRGLAPLTPWGPYLSPLVHLLRSQQLHGLVHHRAVPGQQHGAAVLLPQQHRPLLQRPPQPRHRLREGETPRPVCVPPNPIPSPAQPRGVPPPPEPHCSPQGCLQGIESWMKKNILIVAAVALGIAFFEVRRGAERPPPPAIPMWG